MHLGTAAQNHAFMTLIVLTKNAILLMAIVVWSHLAQNGLDAVWNHLAVLERETVTMTQIVKGYSIVVSTIVIMVYLEWIAALVDV